MIVLGSGIRRIDRGARSHGAGSSNWSHRSHRGSGRSRGDIGGRSLRLEAGRMRIEATRLATNERRDEEREAGQISSLRWIASVRLLLPCSLCHSSTDWYTSPSPCLEHMLHMYAPR